MRRRSRLRHSYNKSSASLMVPALSTSEPLGYQVTTSTFQGGEGDDCFASALRARSNPPRRSSHSSSALPVAATVSASRFARRPKSRRRAAGMSHGGHHDKLG